MKKELNYIDLFAGAGGLSEGFIRNGFKPIAHVEISDITIAEIFEQIDKLNNNHKADLIIGGPPLIAKVA